MNKKRRSSFLLTVATGATIGCSSSDTPPKVLGVVIQPCDSGACADAASNGTGGHTVVGLVPNPSAGGHPPGSVILPPGSGGTAGSGGVSGTGGFSHPPGVVPIPSGTGGMPFPGVVIKPPDAGH